MPLLLNAFSLATLLCFNRASGFAMFQTYAIIKLRQGTQGISAKYSLRTALGIFPAHL